MKKRCRSVFGWCFNQDAAYKPAFEQQLGSSSLGQDSLLILPRG